MLTDKVNIFILIKSLYLFLGSDPSAELRLIRHIMKHYVNQGKNARPVKDSSNFVPVTFGLGLIQMDLSEKDNILSLSMWTRYVSIHCGGLMDGVQLDVFRSSV